MADPAFKGTVDEVAVYTKALSGAQVLSHYNAAVGPASTPSPKPAFVDWSTFGDNLAGTNYHPNETTITSANAPSLKLLWTTDLGSAVTAQPLLATGVPISGAPEPVLYIGTEGGSFYALRADTGSIVWKKTLGTVTSTCKDLPNGVFGITGTGTFDRNMNRVYVADGNDSVHAFDMTSGQEAAGWPVTIASTKNQDHIYSALTFNPSNGLLYVETASFCDASPWHGSITAINTAKASIAAKFFPGAPYQGAGVWGTGGVAIDANNDVYLASGNTTTGPTEHSGNGEHLVQLDANLNVLASNYPGLSGTDVDFGATPMVFTAGSCPQEVSAKNKDGAFVTYFTSSIDNLAPQAIAMAPVRSGGEFIGVTAYSPVTNLVYVGNPVGNTLFSRGLNALTPSASCALGFGSAQAWQQTVGPAGVNGNDNDSPTIAGNVVYLTDGVGKQVFAFDAASGAQLWNSGTTITGNVMNAATVDGRVFVGSWDHKIYSFGL